MDIPPSLKPMGLALLIISVGIGYMRYLNATMPRVDFSGQQMLEDSAAGDDHCYKVVTRANETGGEYFTVEILARAGAPGFYPDMPGSPPIHIHRFQNETFTVLEGALHYSANKRNGTLTVGESATIPAGAEHVYWNAGDKDLLITVKLEPAGRMGEKFFECLAGLGTDYKAVGMVHPLQIIVLFDAADVLIQGPVVLQVLLKFIMAPVGRFLGFKEFYPSYASAATTPAAS